MRQWGREEAQTAGGGGYVGDFGERFTDLQRTAGDSNLVQVPGTGYDGGVIRLDRDGGQILP